MYILFSVLRAKDLYRCQLEEECVPPTCRPAQGPGTTTVLVFRKHKKGIRLVLQLAASWEGTLNWLAEGIRCCITFNSVTEPIFLLPFYKTLCLSEAQFPPKFQLGQCASIAPPPYFHLFSNPSRSKMEQSQQSPTILYSSAPVWLHWGCINLAFSLKILAFCNCAVVIHCLY